MPDDRAAAEHVTAVLDALPLDDRELTSDDAERGRQGREALLADPAAAVPLLLDRLADASFAVKDTVYDLVIAMDGPARPILERERGQRGPVIDVWIAGMLAHLGDERAFDRLRSLLDVSDDYARHLAALALALAQLEGSTDAAPDDTVLGALVAALHDTRPLEGTPFTVAGSALAALVLLTGEPLLDPPREIQIYNHEHFLYPPPMHPFLLAADHLTQAPPDEQAAIRARVRRWWETAL